MRRALTEALWGRRALLWLAGAILVLRSAGLAVGLVNLDECDFWLFGRMLREGAVPYVGIADIKPPLTYLAYLAADLAALHHRAVAVPSLGVAAVLATALLLRAAAVRWTGDPRTGWAAAWLSLAAGLCEAPSVNSEVLMNVPAAAALWALARAEREERPGLDLAAGVLAALATLVKLQAGILLVAMAGALVWPGDAARRRRGPRRAALVALGYGLTWAIAAAACAAGGFLDGAYDWVVRRNVFQISSAHVFALGNVLPSIAAALAAASLAWGLALAQARRPGDGFQRALVVLLALTVVPVAIGRRFYEHYFLQFVPPLALLGAPRLVALADGWSALPRARRAAIAAVALLAPLGYLGFTVGRAVAGGYAGQEPRARAIAAWLREHTAPEERVFLWGDYSAIYCLADRLPGTRYMRTAPHVGDFDPLHLPPGFDFRPYRSERDVAAALADLEANAPAIVVDSAAADVHHWSLFPLRDVPELARYVEERYRPIGRPAGAVVYRRRGAAEPEGLAGSGGAAR